MGTHFSIPSILGLIVVVGLVFGPDVMSDQEAADAYGGLQCNSVNPISSTPCPNGGGSLTCHLVESQHRNNQCFSTGTLHIGPAGLDCSNVAPSGRPGYNCPVAPYNNVTPHCDHNLLCWLLW